MARLTPKQKKEKATAPERNYDNSTAAEIRFLRNFHWVRLHFTKSPRYYYKGAWWTHPRGLPEAKRIKRPDREEYIEAPDDPDFELDHEPITRRKRLKLKG